MRASLLLASCLSDVSPSPETSWERCLPKHTFVVYYYSFNVAVSILIVYAHQERAHISMQSFRSQRKIWPGNNIVSPYVFKMWEQSIMHNYALVMLVMSLTGGLENATKICYKRLSSLLSVKYDQVYSNTIRCSLPFTLLLYTIVNLEVLALRRNHTF